MDIRSSAAMPTVCHELNTVNFESGNVTLSMKFYIAKIVLLNITGYADYNFVAKSRLSSKFTTIKWSSIVVCGDHGNRRWNQILVAIATCPKLCPTFYFLFYTDTPKMAYDEATSVKVWRSPGDPVTLTFHLRSWKVLFCKIYLGYV